MSTVLLKILNMSITANWLILAVVLARGVLKKAPKWVFCLLWGLVAIRLICPFSLESSLSLIPSSETIPVNIEMQQEPVIDSGIIMVDEAVNPVITESFATNPGDSANPLQIVIPIVSIIWITGMCIMLIYALISYLRLKRTVRISVSVGNRIQACDEVKTPFILGVFRPIIYVPSSMSEETLKQVIRHERAHLKRHDHWWKPLGFVLLAIYWFNPLCWIAYILLCRDIEQACDEKVIQDMNKDEILAYSQALLDCSFPRRRVTACPLAFGEVGTKKRVKAVLNYKKPAFWIILIAVIVCIVFAIFLMTNPSSNDQQDVPVEVTEDNQSKEISISSDNPEYISGIKVMDLFLADMDQVFESLQLSGKECVTEKIYVVKDGREIQRDLQHYTSGQKVEFCSLDFQIAFFFNKNANTGSDCMTYVNYYRDYFDLESLFADATVVYQGLVKLYGESSELTGSQRFSILNSPEELQSSLAQREIIEHWDLPDLQEDEMLAYSTVNGSSMSPAVLQNYHCRLYIEKAAQGEGYRLYITYRATIYAPSAQSNNASSQTSMAVNVSSVSIQEELVSVDNAKSPSDQLNAWYQDFEYVSAKEGTKVIDDLFEVILNRGSMLARFIDQCVEEIANGQDDKDAVRAFVTNSISIERYIYENLDIQAGIYRNSDGTQGWIVDQNIKTYPISTMVMESVQKQLDQYITTNEENCISYYSDIRFEALDDSYLAAYCTIIIYDETGDASAVFLPLMIEA